MATVGVLMALLSRICSQASSRTRAIFRTVSLIALVITLAGTFASTQFPGVLPDYPKMSLAFLLRNSLIPASAVTAVLIPLWLALGISSFGPPNLRFRPVMFITVGVVAGVFSVVGLALAVFIGCTHAGVCF